MTDYRNRKDRGKPAVEFRWDPLVLASDKTFSTIIRIQVSGWWPEGRPREVALSVYERGQEPPAGDTVRIQKGHGTFPLTGLEPGHHYHVVVYIEDRTPVQDMITVPELPRPKKPEEEELERERIELERAKLASERRKISVQEKEPTSDEKETIALKAKIELVKAKNELERASRKKPEQIPRRISVTMSGEKGRQKLLISVSAEDGSLIPGFVGTVQNGTTVTNYTTKDDGTAVYETNFRELSCPIEIRAGNHPDLVWRARILGPKPER